jgi:crotonobetainyl-CoA:carnitine CoA-transferase CaiB-like acyl-CoA transferase
VAEGRPAPTEVPALDGVRVLELAGGVAVAWAGKLFADLGADVIRVEAADDLVRGRPHGLHRWLNANKRSMTAGEALTGSGLVSDAHLVIHSRRAGEPTFDGLTSTELADRHGSLVVLALTPFGLTGPYADMAAEELNLIHGSSWGFLSPGGATDPTLAPIKAPGHHASIFTATIAATAGLAAVERAAVSGVGEHIDFSAFGAAAKITEFAPAAVSFLGVDASRLGVRTVVPWGIFECADGLMQIICPEQSQWESLVELMGNPEWAQLDVFATGPDRSANSDLVTMYLSEWFATQRVDDLYHAAQAARVAMTPVNTMAQLEVDRQMAAREFFAHTPDGVKVPGPGYRIDEPWWGLRSPAPGLGSHDGERWRSAAPAPDEPVPGSSAGPGRPLDGVRVCDFTWIWAGPACTQLLAHLGADVVKLESPEHQCMFRRLPFSPPGAPVSPDSSGAFQVYNSDKRSVGLDVAHPGAREVVRRLVENSDVVIDNFGVGTMDRLGFGVEDLRAMNPDVIVVSLSGYGQTGPSAQYMAYGPAGGAIAGLYAANGYADGSVYETGVAIGDPGTGITAAWAVVAALAGRRRTRHAARVDVAMVEAVAWTIGEGWMQYLADGVSPRPIGNHDPVWAPHDCYPAAGEDRWVTIACPDDATWRRLCTVLDPDLADDPRFGTAAGRKEHEAALDEIVARWTEGRDRWEVTEALQAVGVPAFPSSSPTEMWTRDPQLDAIGMLERPDHPVTGPRVVPGVPWRLTRGPNGLRRPAPMLGQHTVEVLTEMLGFTAEEVSRFVESGVAYLPGDTADEATQLR